MEKIQIAELLPRFLKETPVPRKENRGFFQKPGMQRIPGNYGIHYLILPRYSTFTAVVAGSASMALETVISPENILATSAL